MSCYFLHFDHPPPPVPIELLQGGWAQNLLDALKNRKISYSYRKSNCDSPVAKPYYGLATEKSQFEFEINNI
jgi:hypothetical protein